MRAIAYTASGDSSTLSLIERDLPVPGPGQVRVRVAVSGVNPTDWKQRRAGVDGLQVPNQDGAGTVDAVGGGVDLAAGDRVWIWEAAWQRPDGTAQEYVVLPRRQVVPLPDGVSFDVGASLGIPALTAHRALTVHEAGPSRLAPGALAGRAVLVAGGAGAVGHAAIQLARWSGADVIATVSGPAKAALAAAAGAGHTVNYRDPAAAEAIRDVVPGGVDIVVEVDPGHNAGLNAAVVAPNASVAVYAGGEVTLPVRAHLVPNVRYQFVLVYTMLPQVKDGAVADVAAAVADGALPVGEAAGLPLHRFPLEATAQAHDAVEAGAVGKVLIDVG